MKIINNIRTESYGYLQDAISKECRVKFYKYLQASDAIVPTATVIAMGAILKGTGGMAYGVMIGVSGTSLKGFLIAFGISLPAIYILNQTAKRFLEGETL